MSASSEPAGGRARSAIVTAAVIAVIAGVRAGIWKTADPATTLEDVILVLRRASARYDDEVSRTSGGVS